MVIALSASLLFFTACSRTDQESEEEVEINIDLDDGTNESTDTLGNSRNSDAVNIPESSASSVKDGKFSLKANGIDINIDIPQSIIEKSNRSDDLYPGSKIRAINVNAQGDDKTSGKGQVEITFFAPDEPKKVAQYFTNKFKDEGGSASLSGTSVSGKTKDGQDYKLTLNSDGNGSKGVLAITGDRE